MTYVGRYAPSPTGELHLGNALAALCAYARARQEGGRILLRMEDIDEARTRPGAAEGILRDLRALGLHFDAGPDREDEYGPYTQTLRYDRYEAALAQLAAAGRLFACTCSRKDIQEASSAPHGPGGARYPGTCRGAGRALDTPGAALRFVVPPGDVVVEDAFAGAYVQDVSGEVGDFVVRRKDGLYAYHLAVVVDDAAMGVTEVVRGRDLLDSAPRQALLFDALGAARPGFGHIPLLVGPDGKRLEKRSGAQTLRGLLSAGASAAQLVGALGAALGLCPAGTALDVDGFVARFSPDAMRPETVALPADVFT